MQTHANFALEDSPRTADVLGIPVRCVDADRALRLIETALEQTAVQNAPAQEAYLGDPGRTTPLHVVTLNPEMIMQAQQDPELDDILKTAGLSIPDGAGVVWALRRQGIAVQRLPGIELAEALLARAAQRGWPVAFIGAQAATLDAAIAALSTRYPGLAVAYAHHGFFSTDEEEAACAQACADARPKAVFVALGAPRQEKWIRRHAGRFTPNTALLGVGGSLDVWSGLKRRAPAVLRRLNLEWAYRIASEPWRLQRTYKTLPLFALKVLCYRGSCDAPASRPS
ncbi:MAG: WecB/TagA/CpsF family glycosyltransferase [Vampirovibrionales bacterium]|nr:WecB/TagA/CpsF family glycosyltransferase [Vampirovibrionales bacterium]